MYMYVYTAYSVYSIQNHSVFVLYIYVYVLNTLTDVLRNAEVFTGQQPAAQQKPNCVCLLFMQT